MITRGEIERLARLNRINPYFQEKHYLMSLVLSSLYSNTSDELVFKGGTYLWFFHSLPRASEDLDFTATAEIDVGPLVDEVVRDLEAYGARSELRKEATELSFRARLGVEGPLYDGRNRNHVRVDVSLRGDVAEPPEFTVFRSPYPDVPDFTLLGMNLREVLAEKTRAMLWRRRARDLLDVHHLLGTGVDMDRELLARKLDYYELVMDGPLLEGALTEIGHIWKAELSPLVKGKMPDLESIREDVGRRLAGLL